MRFGLGKLQEIYWRNVLKDHSGQETEFSQSSSLRNRTIVARPTSNVEPPFSLEKFPTADAFYRYIRSTVVQRHGISQHLLEPFRLNMLELKAGLHKSNRKIIKNAKYQRQAWEQRLLPTSATLLVVPDALLEHWFQQIHEHLDRVLFDTKTAATDGDDNGGGGRGVVYLDGVGDITDAHMPLGPIVHSSSNNNQRQPLPDTWELAKYMIVVTTFSRCDQEYWKEVELGNMSSSSGSDGTAANKKRSHPSSSTTTNNNDSARTRSRRGQGRNNDAISDGKQKKDSRFLNMRWLRLVIDEGHELGAYEGGNAVTRFINEVAAERRWVLSGTPTTGDEDDLAFSAKALDQLQRLLLFLRHPDYGTMPPPIVTREQSSSPNNKKSREEDQKQRAKEAWVSRVKEPFLQKKAEGRQELVKVLRSVAVLHRKEDISLPKPIFHNSEVNVAVPTTYKKICGLHRRMPC